MMTFCLCKINSPSNREYSGFRETACGFLTFSTSLPVGTSSEQKSQGIQDNLITIFSSAGFLLKHLAEIFLYQQDGPLCVNKQDFPSQKRGT